VYPLAAALPWIRSRETALPCSDAGVPHASGHPRAPQIGRRGVQCGAAHPAGAPAGAGTALPDNGGVPRPTPSDAPSRHTADPDLTRAELATLRPDLAGRYDAELPGARAAVLARLLGALEREPLPGLSRRGPGRAVIGTATVRYPAAAAAPFAVAPSGLTADVQPHRARREPAAPDCEGRQLGGRRHGGREPGGPGHVGREPDGPGPGSREPGRPCQEGREPAARDGYGRPPAGSGGDGRDPGGPGIDDPGTLVRLLWPGAALAAEIDNSVANLALARADLPPQRLPRPGDPDGLGLAEQLLTDGHPLHPCCRTRGGMSVADVLAYAPEHSPVIRLRRLRVPAGRWHGGAPPMLYAHPWQAERIRDRYPWLSDDGETGPVRPLMSLRTVAPLGGGPHVKTAVEVQMTSAVRTVSPAAVHNGPVLSALLRTITADLPLGVLAETTAGAVIVDGRAQRHLAYLRREAPAAGPDETVVPLAMYAASPLLLSTVTDPYALMAALGTVLFAPLVTVLARGVALEAHGQNTLVVLRGGRPVRALYRDLGGVRVSAARLRAAGLQPPPLDGDLPSDDPRVLRTKLAAAALGTVAAELVAALSRHHGAEPNRLWGMVAAAIRGAGTADVPHLLRDPLPIKATTAMRLAADPLDDLWAHADNPLEAYA
jgi:hypothetical protein